MSRKLLLVIILSVFTLGDALKCYQCAGTKTSDCAQAKSSSMAVSDCVDTKLHESANYGLFNLTQHTNRDYTGYHLIYCVTVSETDYKPHLLVRGCQLFPPFVKDPCAFLAQHVNIEDCKACTGELCNKQPESVQWKEYFTNSVN